MLPVGNAAIPGHECPLHPRYGARVEDAVLRVAVLNDPVLAASGPVAINNGLNVLYGLNGAGKSRFLRGVSDALQGVESDVRVGLLVNASSSVHSDAKSSHARKESITSALARALAKPDDFDHFQPGTPAALQRISPARAAGVLDGYLDELLPPDGEARDWVLENRLFLLVPSGSKGAPQWLAWAVADPSIDWVRRETVVLDEIWDRFVNEYDDDDEEANDSSLTRYDDAVSSHTLFPQSGFEMFVPGFSSMWIDPYPPIGFRYGNTNLIDPIVVSGTVDFGLDLVDNDRDTRSATESLLRSVIGSSSEREVFEDTETGESAAEERAHQAAASLSEKVTELLQAALQDGPFARLDLTDPTDRLFSPPFQWRFSRNPNGYHEIGSTQLSRAEKLWADRSILDVIHRSEREQTARPSLYLYDEPEAALHRAAESHMANELLRRAQDPRTVIVAATHSPELLDAAAATVIEVKRSQPKSTVQVLDRASRGTLSQLGLNPSDLLRLTRVFLLVEGMHDEVLLEHFIGDRLRRARAEIIPMHGGRKLATTVDSRVLFDFTDAHLVAVLDNLRAEHVTDVWARAQEAAVQGDPAAAKRIIEEELSDDSGESGYLRAWLRRALDYGIAARATPEGLGAADIVEYLPVERIVSSAESWAQLHLHHQEARRVSEKTTKNFKEWLTNRYGSRFGADDLRRYAEGLPVPPDFERLAKRVEAISSDR